MTTATLLFAQEPPDAAVVAKPNPKDAVKSDALWITVGLLALVLVVGAVVITAVDRWRKRTTPFDKDALKEGSNFREMYEAGEITHAEYERIRNKMAGRVRNTVGLKPTETVPPPLEPGPSETPNSDSADGRPGGNPG
jgi:hypothetical protein